MRKHVIISFSSARGTRQLHMGHRAYRTIIIVIGVIVSALVLSGAGLYYLSQSRMALVSESSLLNHELSSLSALKDQLQTELQSKEDEVQLVSDRLEDIEQMLDISNQPTQEPILSRLDLAATQMTTRRIMLTQIPSGSPVKEGRISSGYGKRVHPVTGKIKFHRGQDFAVNIGTKVYAPANGVVEVTRASRQGSGNFLRLQHSFGFSSSYSHLSKFAVESGQFVKKGQLIGYSGNTGLTSGPHLHYEVRFVLRPLDPKPFVDWDIAHFDTLFTQVRQVKWRNLIQRVEEQLNTQMSSMNLKRTVSNEVQHAIEPRLASNLD